MVEGDESGHSQPCLAVVRGSIGLSNRASSRLLIWDHLPILTSQLKYDADDVSEEFLQISIHASAHYLLPITIISLPRSFPSFSQLNCSSLQLSCGGSGSRGILAAVTDGV